MRKSIQSSKTPRNREFPRYFEVDDVYVMVFEEDGDIIAKNHLGFPWPPIRALFDGHEVTEEVFLNACQSNFPQGRK